MCVCMCVYVCARACVRGVYVCTKCMDLINTQNVQAPNLQPVRKEKEKKQKKPAARAETHIRCPAPLGSCHSMPIGTWTKYFTQKIIGTHALRQIEKQIPRHKPPRVTSLTADRQYVCVCVCVCVLRTTPPYKCICLYMSTYVYICLRMSIYVDVCIYVCV